MMNDKGLDFSKIKRYTVDGGIVYKDDYFNSSATKYKKSEGKVSEVSSNARRVLVLAMESKCDYEGVLEMLMSAELEDVKESYWDMAKRVGAYGSDALESWVTKAQPLSYYKKTFSLKND